MSLDLARTTTHRTHQSSKWEISRARIRRRCSCDGPLAGCDFREHVPCVCLLRLCSFWRVRTLLVNALLFTSLRRPFFPSIFLTHFASSPFPGRTEDSGLARGQTFFLESGGLCCGFCSSTCRPFLQIECAGFCRRGYLGCPS